MKRCLGKSIINVTVLIFLLSPTSGEPSEFNGLFCNENYFEPLDYRTCICYHFNSGNNAIFTVKRVKRGEEKFGVAKGIFTREGDTLFLNLKAESDGTGIEDELKIISQSEIKSQEDGMIFSSHSYDSDFCNISE